MQQAGDREGAIIHSNRPYLRFSGTQEHGSNEVSVPTHFYKVIFDPVRIEAIAFCASHG